jgi:3-deoxy-7-phosphoheptulonate synthase
MANKFYKLTSFETKKRKTIIKIGNLKVGGKEVVIMAGPCAIESKKQLLACGRLVKKLGGKVLRGGAFKPRTSPYSFQGLEEKGLKILALVKKEIGILTITEVMKMEDVNLVAKYVDILQIGARNMQNYPLLKVVGQSQKPVVLKRGLASTIEEWLSAAEYILKEGNFRVILCERGIRTFETSTRFTLDISSVPVIKKLSHLPIIVDPSHASGSREFVPSLAKAAIAAGADGLLIEFHPNPEKALSDGPQSLTFSQFRKLIRDLKLITKVIGREV